MRTRQHRIAVTQVVATALACAAFLGGARAAAAQVVVPTTACDAALNNPDVHPQPGMPLEDGTQAFAYGGSFVAGGGTSVTITVALTFQPGPDATIRLSALDESCGGVSADGVLFSYTFAQLTSTTNAITFDASGEVGINGAMQAAASAGKARYLFVDVWDGELPSTHATHSYLIDVQHPANPSVQ